MDREAWWAPWGLFKKSSPAPMYEFCGVMFRTDLTAPVVRTTENLREGVNNWRAAVVVLLLSPA